MVLVRYSWIVFLVSTVRVILYSIMYAFSMCSWLPLVCVCVWFCCNWKAVQNAQHRCPSCLHITGIKSRWGSWVVISNGAPRLRELLHVAVQSGALQHYPQTLAVHIVCLVLIVHCSNCLLLLPIVYWSMLVLVRWTRFMPPACELSLLCTACHIEATHDS